MFSCLRLVDEFERWQKEIQEVEAQVEGSEFGSLSGNVGGTGAGEDSERPSTPPEGEEGFTDDDGTVYKWDRSLRAWVPQVRALHVSLLLSSSSYFF